MKIVIECANCRQELALYTNSTNIINTADMHEYAMKEEWQNVKIADYDATYDLYFCPKHTVDKEDIGVRYVQS